MSHKIANGYFYDVYDVGNNKVLKKKRSFYEIAKEIKGKNNINFFKLIVKTFQYIKSAERNTKIVRQKMSSVPQELIGNPEFLNKVDYTQDKVILLMDYFDTHSLNENKLIVEKYAELIKKFFGFGMHDHVYKFKNSYGVNNEGEVVFIDFNEVTFSKEKVIELVKTHHWKNEAQFRKFPAGELKDFIELKLSEVLVSEVVNAHWRD